MEERKKEGKRNSEEVINFNSDEKEKDLIKNRINNHVVRMKRKEVISSFWEDSILIIKKGIQKNHIPVKVQENFSKD